MQAAKFAPLLGPRLSCYAIAIRAACLIQQAWLWHVRLCYEDAGCPVMDAAGNGAPVTPSGTRLPASSRRLQAPRGSPGSLPASLEGPPFRFLLRPVGDAEPNLPHCDAVSLSLDFAPD